MPEKPRSQKEMEKLADAITRLFHHPTWITDKEFIEVDDKDLGYWTTIWKDGRICSGVTVDNEQTMEEIAKETGGIDEVIDPDIDYYHVSLGCTIDWKEAKKRFQKLKESVEKRYL